MLRISSIIMLVLRVPLRCGDEKVEVFCLSVTLLNGRGCANDFAVFEYGNTFETAGLGWFVLVIIHPCLGLSLHRYSATTEC